MACEVCPLTEINAYHNIQLTQCRSQKDDLVIVKSVAGHPHVVNERDVLQRFQAKSPYIRPLIDEIQDPAEPITIVLKHLDTDLLKETVKRPLSRKEIKYVSIRVLEALNALHEDGYVHTGKAWLIAHILQACRISDPLIPDIKLDNIFLNLKKDEIKKDEIRFSDVQLGDFGGSYPQDSHWAKSGTPVGAPIWNSPEILMNLPWNTATDIWSFGNVVSTSYISSRNTRL